MPKHSYFSNNFSTHVTKTKQRYMTTFPKTMGESKEIIYGAFSYNPKTKKLGFTIEGLDNYLAVINRKNDEQQ